MKRLIVIFLVIVSLIGCKTTKNVNNSNTAKSDALIRTEKVVGRTDTATYKQNAISTNFDVSDETATKMTEITRSFNPDGKITAETFKTTEIAKSAANKTKTSDKGFVKAKVNSDIQREAKTDSAAQAKNVTATTEYSDNQKTGTNIKVIAMCLAVIVVSTLSLIYWIRSWK